MPAITSVDDEGPTDTIKPKREKKKGKVWFSQILVFARLFTDPTSRQSARSFCVATAEHEARWTVSRRAQNAEVTAAHRFRRSSSSPISIASTTKVDIGIPDPTGRLEILCVHIFSLRRSPIIGYRLSSRVTESPRPAQATMVRPDASKKLPIS